MSPRSCAFVKGGGADSPTWRSASHVDTGIAARIREKARAGESQAVSEATRRYREHKARKAVGAAEAGL